jgi:hypothetical protein
LTDEVIAVEEDETILKSAAIHANLVLDTIALERTTRMYLRLDRTFDRQAYFKELAKLDFASLIEAMNCKVDYQNEQASK